MAPASYRFALRPRWIVSHLLVAVLVVTMIGLGLWQLRRLDTRRDFNRLVRARQDAPVAVLDDLVTPDDTLDDGEAVAYRRVRATGTYDVEEEVMVRSRSLNGQPGAWILSPLITGRGAVVVNRGWIPTQGVLERVPADVEPTEGEVTVSGLLLATQTRGRVGPKDPATGELSSLARVDLARYQRQVPFSLYPAYIQLARQRPAQEGDLPRPVPPPDLTEGPHLNYAVQWFSFTAIAVVGYPLILRRQARNRAGEVETPDRAPEAVPTS